MAVGTDAKVGVMDALGATLHAMDVVDVPAVDQTVLETAMDAIASAVLRA